MKLVKATASYIRIKEMQYKYFKRVNGWTDTIAIRTVENTLKIYL